MGSTSPPRVCVTGGGGFIASWLVKLLLSRGYVVHATVRDPCDPKNSHLKQLDKASENLRLFKADVLDYDTLTPAIQGCDGVFHLATPVPEHKVVDPKTEVLDIAVEGTVNVLKACSAMKIRKVVFMSSTATIVYNPNWPKDKVKDETCWADMELCKQSGNWYPVGKIMAERAAMEYADRNGLNIVMLCPSFVFGPLLQPTVNTTSKFLIYLIKGGPDQMDDRVWGFVDVRDVANALLLLYEKEEASGRYICSAYNVCTRDLVAVLKKMYPNYDSISGDKIDDAEHKAPATSQKLLDLGWEPRKLEEMLADSVESYEKAGLLRDSPGQPCRLPGLVRLILNK